MFAQLNVLRPVNMEETLILKHSHKKEYYSRNLKYVYDIQ